ncbi:hypothetical protein AWA2013_00600 [Lactiplantibacillus plantarum]|uniref:DUF1643 domain-containing protein n=1 Tax=Lactiplantibacillus plantarum TaxID=1590 RepID=UPI0025745AF7|nr:DUF1643 domain-containing protein [Lactiplantibacillus plantarum]BEI48654.1 hypothetical protein AWA2013_00600 [Lactiplantibacillus plantarum]
MVVKSKQLAVGNTKSFTIKTESRFSKDRKHRLLLSYSWDDKSPSVLVITNFPGISDGLVSDLTTSLVINNVAVQGFGSVKLVNLFSLVGGLGTKDAYTAGFLAATDQVILLEASKVNTIVIATGSFGSSDKRGKQRQQELVNQLETADLMGKVKWLVNSQGKPVHPLNSRRKWTLKDES